MRIVVAMSGGVDSSVTAGLLARAGHEVVGVTLQLYDHGRAVDRAGTCCAGRDIQDARRVADALGIPHYVLDYEKAFAQSVMQPFADSYRAGETPIPCVLCNQKVKFTDLLQFARDLGADGLATGHYVRRIDGPAGPELHRGLDPARDQSYFMFTTTAEQLAYLQFPLGGMAKDAVRALAADYALPVASKPDSQDICFVPQGRYTKVVERLRPADDLAGDIVTEDGTVVGRHDGIINFTVGQRKGIGGGSGAPRFVLRLDAQRRQVVVGPVEALHATRVTLRDLNWIGPALAPGDWREVTVRVRSTRPPASGRIRLDGQGGAEIDLAEPERAIAPGQAGVIYDGDRLLGGGWIVAPATRRQDLADRLDKAG